MVAGGHSIDAPLASLFQEVVDGERWPPRWSGGRRQNVHKRNGPVDDCDESRGILLESHIAKSFKQLLSNMAASQYEQHILETQSGAVAGCGTDHAAHLVYCFRAFCDVSHMPYFAWYVDLVKALDLVIREIVLGWLCEANDLVAYL